MPSYRRIALSIAAVCIAVAETWAGPASAQSFSICSARATGVLKIKTRCSRSETKIRNVGTLIGPAGQNGAPGTNGSNGADGQNGQDGAVRIYGDGSAGALDNDAGVNILDAVNTQFTNITIEVGTTLQVASGTTLRCTGTFNNKGTIQVLPYGLGGGCRTANSPVIAANCIPSSPGAGLGPSENGEVGDNSAYRYGGYGASFLTAGQAQTLLHFGALGGGGGGGSYAVYGSRGGGTLRIFCKGPIFNSGSISADGEARTGHWGGGGSGGIVLLASGSGITVNSGGKVEVNGSPGGAALSFSGAGGGGGGGIVHIVAPTISIEDGAILQALGASGGANSGVTFNSIRGGGGAGGSLGGGGGVGAFVSDSGESGSGGLGSDGYIFQTAADPIGLLF